MMAKASDLAIFVAGGALLGVMMTTAPDYNSVFTPFATHAPAGEIADGRLFDARFLGARPVQRITFDRLGKEVTRDTTGIFLIADFEVSGVTSSTRIAAGWKGPSGRLYKASTRFDYAPNTVDERSFQPGLTDRSFAIFELPEDEVSGGQLVLSARIMADLDSALYLDSSNIAPTSALIRLDP